MRYKTLKLTLALIASVFAFTLNNNSVFAATDSSDVTKKALLTGVEYCYKKGAIKTEVEAVSKFTHFSNMITGGTSESYIKLPTGLTKINDNDVSCKELFTGYSGLGGSFDGVIKLVGKSPNPSGKEAKIAFLEGMGFEKTTVQSTTNQKCIAFNYKEKFNYAGGVEKEVTTDQICGKLDSSGKITELSVNQSTATYYGATATQYAPPKFFVVTSEGKINVPRATIIIDYGYNYKTQTPLTTDKGVGDKWDDFTTDLRTKLSSAGTGKNGVFNYTYTVYNQSMSYTYTYLRSNGENSNVDESNEGDVGFKMKYSGSEANLVKTAAIANKYLSGKDDFTLDFSDEEKIQFLVIELTKHFFDGKQVGDYWMCDASNWADYGGFTEKINIASNLTRPQSECRINTTVAASTENINGFSGNRFDVTGGTKLDLAGTIAEINRLVGDLPEDAPVAPPETTIPGNVDTDDSVTPECFNAASSLGWIICPVIKAVGEATSGIYNLIEENFLQTNSDSFASGSATYESWSKFRDFANIIFAILFIIVILSQVTGIGISNYGVKKALPRLIVVAVLVNLSFIACQVATDVSNILGDSLNSLFGGWADAVTVPADTFAGNIGDFASGLVSTLITGGIGVGAGYLAVISWEFWIWPLVLFLLTAVISILFFFLILGVRQAGVIILTVIAPIAIVCYALPNTKKFFDRWLKIYTALIFVYPICGILMGGGEFASKILLANAQATDAGFIIQLVAMLISVVPFFFIPSLVRGSMAAMGNLGAKIAGMGDRLGRSGTGAIRRSDSYQDSQRRLGMRNALRSANRIKEGKDVQSRLARRLKGVGLVGAGNALDKSAQRSRNRAIDRYNRGAMEDIKAQAGAEALEEGSARYDAMISNMQDRQLEERADAFAQTYKDSGMDYDIDQMYNEHHNAVQALLADPTDRDARARLMATHKLLGGTDAGRAKLKESFYSTASQLQHNPASDPTVAARQNEGFKLAAQTLHRSHAGAIKGADRGFESFLMDASGGIEKVTGNGSSFDEGVITTERRADGSVAEMRGTIASKYDTAKISSYDASSIVKADEGALDRMLRAAQIPVDSTDPAKMSEDSRQQFIDMTTEALTNENVQVQPKIREKLNAIRTAIGAPAIAAPRASGDSIRIDHNGGGSNPGSGTPTTGNPTPGQGTPPSRATSAPIPDGATMTDSGIVIAPGNMSGEQIRRYAERMRDFNNGQNNNGQNNNNGGSGIILPH